MRSKQPSFAWRTFLSDQRPIDRNEHRENTTTLWNFIG